MSSTFRPKVIALALGAALVASLVGCSSPASDSPTPSADGAAAKWGSCMRDAGISIEDPTDAELASGGLRIPEGIDEDAFQRASAGCGGPKGASTAQKDTWTKQTQGYIACMAEAGITGFDESQAAQGTISWEGIDQETPAFKAADPACKKKHLSDWGGL